MKKSLVEDLVAHLNTDLCPYLRLKVQMPFHKCSQTQAKQIALQSRSSFENAIYSLAVMLNYVTTCL